MADEWIKMRRNLLNHPKVVRISSALLADKFRTVGGLHAVWSVFDEFSVDGKLNGYSFSAMDSSIGWPGFCEAMGSVNWLLQDGQSLVVPEFDEHNGASGKRRSQEAKRKNEARKLSALDADKNRTKSALEEEEEEEEFKSKSNNPLPPSGRRSKVMPVPEGFVQFWQAYPRKEGKGGALKAYAKTIEAERRVIATVLPQFSASWKWLNEPEYIPHAATWLNQRRWEDVPPPTEPPRPRIAAKPLQPSRQARQLQVVEDLINDRTYYDTAARQLAHEGHWPRAATPADLELALDACTGRATGHDDGVD